MGSVTKTTIEGVGDVMKSTSYHFSSFEDFMEYECVVDEKGQQDNQPAVKRACGRKTISGCRRYLRTSSQYWGNCDGYGSTMKKIIVSRTEWRTLSGIVAGLGQKKWRKSK